MPENLLLQAMLLGSSVLLNDTKCSAKVSFYFLINVSLLIRASSQFDHLQSRVIVSERHKYCVVKKFGKRVISAIVFKIALDKSFYNIYLWLSLSVYGPSLEIVDRFFFLLLLIHCMC